MPDASPIGELAQPLPTQITMHITHTSTMTPSGEGRGDNHDKRRSGFGPSPGGFGTGSPHGRRRRKRGEIRAAILQLLQDDGLIAPQEGEAESSHHRMRHTMAQVGMAARQVAQAGDDAQVDAAIAVLEDARRTLYGILAGGDA
jgi:hypothetical protein